MIFERHKIWANRTGGELKLALKMLQTMKYSPLLIETNEGIKAQIYTNTNVSLDDKLTSQYKQVSKDKAAMDECNNKHSDISNTFQLDAFIKDAAKHKADMYGQPVWPAAESKPSGEVARAKKHIETTEIKNNDRLDTLISEKREFITAGDETETHAQQIDTYAQSAEKTTENKREAKADTREQAIIQFFSNNKLITFDKIAAARTRIMSKLGTLNSALEYELLVDGATIAVAYIEAGMRTYSAYATAMTSDFGDGINLLLRDFYECACYYLGLDIEDMTAA
jgi:hypothetical protein